MSIDVLEDYPSGNRMQGLCVSLSKDNITVSGCTLKEGKKKKEKNNNPALGEKKKRHTSAWVWCSLAKYGHLDGKNHHVALPIMCYLYGRVQET